MRAVVNFVANNPGLAMLHAVEYVAPKGSRRFGYRTVHRTIDAGLVRTVKGPRGSVLLYPIA